MKTLLTLILLIPSLVWGSEKKARELYVQAEIEFKKRGCSADIYRQNIQSLRLTALEVAFSGADNLSLEEIKSIIMEFEEPINYFQKCTDAYLKEIQPRYEKIVEDYSDTEVAYKIVASGEYLSKNEAEQIPDMLNKLKNVFDNAKSKLGTTSKNLENLKKDKKLDEDYSKKNKELDEDYSKYIDAEPMTNQEITALINQIQGCLSLPTSFDIPSEKVKVNIQVNKDRTIKSFKIADENSIFGSESDPKIRVLNEISLRALNHPDCETLNVPPEKYFHWREINFTFNFKSVGMWK